MNPRTPTLELAHAMVRVEPMRLEHAPALFDAIGDPTVWTYIPFERPRDVGGMRRYMESALDNAAKGNEMAFVFVDLLTNTICGTSRFSDLSPTHRALEIGWSMIGPRWQRSHVNTSVKRLMIGYAIESMDFGRDDGVKGCIRVQLKCDARNLKSQNAMLRIGCQYEGTLRRHRILSDGFVRDTMYYSVTDLDWPATKARLDSLLIHSRNEPT